MIYSTFFKVNHNRFHFSKEMMAKRSHEKETEMELNNRLAAGVSVKFYGLFYSGGQIR